MFEPEAVPLQRTEQSVCKSIRLLSDVKKSVTCPRRRQVGRCVFIPLVSWKMRLVLITNAEMNPIDSNNRDAVFNTSLSIFPSFTTSIELLNVPMWIHHLSVPGSSKCFGRVTRCVHIVFSTIIHMKRVKQHSHCPYVLMSLCLSKR